MDFFITLEIVFWLYLVLGPALPSMGQAEEYYTYRDSAAKLVISNQKPPPDSKIIKQQSLSDLAESENPQVQTGSTTQPNGNTPNSKPSNNK
jgi:hypothetical protein